MAVSMEATTAMIAFLGPRRALMPLPPRVRIRLFGGLFVNRAQAMKYALFENGHHPETIVLTANTIELDMHRKASSHRAPETIEASLQHRAA